MFLLVAFYYLNELKYPIVGFFFKKKLASNKNILASRQNSN